MSIQVVVAKIIPLANYEPQVVEFNGALEAMVSGSGQPESLLSLVDMHAGFALDNDTYDGVHPNNAGASKMADRWYDVIDDWLA